MPLSIGEILNMDDAMPVTGLRARIKAAFEAKTGEGANGPWCFVPLILSADGSNDEIRATWFSPTTTDHKRLKGRPVEISARKNKKNTLSGAKVQHRDYKGQAQVQIVVDSDHLRFLDEETEGVGYQPTASNSSPKPPQGGTGTVRQPMTGRDAQALIGKLSDKDLIDAMRAWASEMRRALSPSDPASVPHEVIQPLLSTFLIAATSDRSTMAVTMIPQKIAPPSAVPTSEPTDTTGDNLGGALDGFDDEPPPHTDDDIPF